MPETLNAHQLIQLAQCLTRMQSALTDYELHHYPEMTENQKRSLEDALTNIARAAGRLYAYAVKLEFEDINRQLAQLQKASDGLKKFLKTAQKIAVVLDIAGVLASLASAIIIHDIDGISTGIDGIVQMIANT